MRVHSWDEFSTLKTVVLGVFDFNSHGLESQSHSSDHELALSLVRKASPQWYIDEVNEDLFYFESVLRSYDVTIVKPSWPFPDSLFKSPTCYTSGYDLFNVRDNHIVFGDILLSTPPSSRYRMNEHYGFYNIFRDIHQNYPFKWLFAPRPSLPPGFELPLNTTPTQLQIRESEKHSRLSAQLTERYTSLSESEIVFDAANIIRIGKDVLYLVSSTGNLSGFHWLQATLGSQFRLHLTRTYRSSHLDSTICPLRPGLVLLNGDRVDNTTVPDIFNKWDKIYFTDVSAIPESEINFFKEVRKPISDQLASLGWNSPIEHISSPWGGLNVFSLSEDVVCVESSQINLIRTLEQHGLTVIPIPYRHCFTMLGCLHCSTLDIERAGSLLDYCS